MTPTPSKASAPKTATTPLTPRLPDSLLMRFLMPLFTTKRSRDEAGFTADNETMSPATTAHENRK
jgi:hypothetical protein